MTRSAYVPDPAGWIFLARNDMCIGVAVPDSSPLVQELWALLETSTDAGVALDLMTRAGISSTASFVIVTLGADAKVLVRGGATVTVDGAVHDTVTGVGFSSWAERSFVRIDRFDCEVTATGSSSGTVRLPLLSGVVRAGWFGGVVAGVALSDETASVGAVETPVVAPASAAVIEAPPRASEPPALVMEAPANISVPPAPVAEATVIAIDDDEAESELPQVAPAVSAYDHLFGETAYRSVEDAAVRPSEEVEEVPSKPGLEEHTVVASDLAMLRAQRRASRGRAAAPAAVVAAFLVELSTGGREVLDQVLVIGRAPAATALGGGNIPRLVTMTTPNQDISRTHAQIAVEGGTVVVTDLHSRNGTIVTLPGRSAQKLREGETTVVIPGTIIDLGDGATLTVREV
jgi:hypothetical protein